MHDVTTFKKLKNIAFFRFQWVAYNNTYIRCGSIYTSKHWVIKPTSILMMSIVYLWITRVTIWKFVPILNSVHFVSWKFDKMCLRKKMFVERDVCKTFMSNVLSHQDRLWRHEFIRVLSRLNLTDSKETNKAWSKEENLSNFMKPYFSYLINRRFNYLNEFQSRFLDESK